MGPSEGRIPPCNPATPGANPGARLTAQLGAEASGGEVPRFSRPDQVPDGPPPSVWQEVDRAAQVAEDLIADGRELHFELDPAGGRLTIQVRDRRGRVLRTLTPGEALDVASGSGSACVDEQVDEQADERY